MPSKNALEIIHRYLPWILANEPRSINTKSQVLTPYWSILGNVILCLCVTPLVHCERVVVGSTIRNDKILFINYKNNL
jgi:hypothetical protein